MESCLILHTLNQKKLEFFFEHVQKKIEKKDTSLFLHSFNYAPWKDEKLKNEIISFRTYNAFPTQKKPIESIIEIVFKVKQENLIIYDEDDFNYNLTIKKNDFLKLNLDTNYHTIKWFLIDLRIQIDPNFSFENDFSQDYFRLIRKINSNLFNKRIIHIDGGMGDHILSLPLLEKLSPNLVICCKYPHLFQHIKCLNIIPWTHELFGNYVRFVYEYGSNNNSETIVDAFFEMYGEKREKNDFLKYNGKFIYDSEILKKDKIVLICTSAAKINNQDSNKDWSDIRWFMLINYLKKQGFHTVQVGSKKDNQIPNVDLKFLEKPIDELAGLIEKSTFWVSVDTFFHHFAASIKPEVGICLTPFYNGHAKHEKVKYIERDCGKNFYDRRWWLDSQQPERKECMDLITLNSVLEKIKQII